MGRVCCTIDASRRASMVRESELLPDVEAEQVWKAPDGQHYRWSP